VIFKNKKGVLETKSLKLFDADALIFIYTSLKNKNSKD
jgi:hypothetical protein